jgi:predicted aspartyl protease
MMEIRSMRAKDIKGQLDKRRISTQGIFDKEDLVQRLFEARKNPPYYESTQRQTQSDYSRRKQTTSASGTTTSRMNKVIQVPLYLTSLQSGTRIAALNGSGITVEAKDHPYPSIKIKVMPVSGNEFTLNLLLDTACSGMVLRPSVVQQHKLPSLSTPVTMTGAGGTAMNTGLTQLDRYRLDESSEISFGPLPAAVQDIGALPSTLDGIIGLSFLNQFEGIDMNFRRGTLSLYPRGTKLPPPQSDLTLVAEGPMSLVPSLGVYMVDVVLGGRGPVKMLVDSGASDSFLNWKGVSDLSLSRDSKFLDRLPVPMGAMGSDAVAMELTHRIGISSNLNLGKCYQVGLSLKDTKRLSIGIGNIAILEAVKGAGVGGILGIDAFMRCVSVRLSFHSNRLIQFLVSK